MREGALVSTSLATAVRAGEPIAVARALTVVENDADASASLLAELSGAVGRAHRVGVTGPPGAGKSSLIAALAKAWRAAGRRVGIVAVDPTSPFSGGALLGDRIRMTGLSGDAGVFIRSLATRGALGGLARTTHEAADVLDAAGFDPVVIETVGVGQSEVAIAGAADTVVVIVSPGSGDSVQAMKAGLLEAADLLVVNQADRDGAEALAADLASAVELRADDLRLGSTKPAILLTAATTGLGVEELRAAIDLHRKMLEDGAGLEARRLARARARIREEVDRRRSLLHWADRDLELDRLAAEVGAGRMTVAKAAGRLAAQGGAGRPPPGSLPSEAP